MNNVIVETNRRFEEAVGRYTHLVYASALRQLREPAAAEDALQAVFLVLLRKLPGLAPSRELGPWLMKVTRYVCQDVLKQQRRRQRHERGAGEEQRGREERGVDSEEIREGISEHLDAALAALSESERRAIIFYYLEHSPASASSASSSSSISCSASIEATAEALGVSVPAAKKRLLRGLAHLREYFAAKGVRTSEELLLGSLGAFAAVKAPEHLLNAIGAMGSGASASAGIGGLAPLLSERVLHVMAVAKVKAVAVIAAGLVAAVTLGTLAVVPWWPAGSNRSSVGNAAVGNTSSGRISDEESAGLTRLVRCDMIVEAATLAELRQESTPVTAESDTMEFRTGQTRAIHRILAAYAQRTKQTQQRIYSQSHSAQAYSDLGRFVVPDTQQEYYYLPPASYFVGTVSGLNSLEVTSKTLDPLTIRVYSAFSETGELPEPIVGTGSFALQTALQNRQTLLHILPLGNGRFFWIQAHDAVRLTDAQAACMRSLQYASGDYFNTDPAEIRWRLNRLILWQLKVTEESKRDVVLHWRYEVGDVSVFLAAIKTKESFSLPWMPNGDPSKYFFTLVPEPDTRLILYFPGVVKHPSGKSEGFTQWVELPGQERQVLFGAGVGDWRQVATFRPPETGDLVVVRDEENLHDIRIHVLDAHTLQFYDTAEEEYRIAVVDKKNQEQDYRYTSFQAAMVPANQSRRGGNYHLEHRVAADQLSHYVLYKRPRKWKVIEGFAEHPNMAPPVHCSDADVYQAAQEMKVSKYQEEMEKPDSPITYLAHFKEVIARENPEEIRSYFYGTSPVEMRCIQATVEMIVATEQLRDLCTERFGAMMTAEFFAGIPTFPENFIHSDRWTVREDDQGTRFATNDGERQLIWIEGETCRKEGGWTFDFRTEEHGGLMLTEPVMKQWTRVVEKMLPFQRQAAEWVKSPEPVDFIALKKMLDYATHEFSEEEGGN